MDYYEQVCGVAAGAHNAALGAQQPYDFAAWPADAVIINLGTNDEGAMNNPAPGQTLSPAKATPSAPRRST